MKNFKPNSQMPDAYQQFWVLADNTKMSEKYRIDKNLQYLEIAPLEILRKIFIQYRFFTHHYIADLAILISKLPFGELKTILSDILYEELGSGKSAEAHPILYDNFLISIGVSPSKLNQQDFKCLNYLQTIQDSLHRQSWSYGIGLRGMGGECLCQIYLATMHHYFSKNSSIIAIQEKIAWKFWEIHIGEVDLHHQTIVRASINDLIIEQPETTVDLINGYLESLEAWDHYWKQIFKAAK